MMQLVAGLVSGWLLLCGNLSAMEHITLDTDDTSIDIRVFPAEGERLLLGFPCDEGKSVAEENTARSLANDGIEVWMPDMLSAYMLPKLRSSLHQIPGEDLGHIIEAALKTGKQVYLIAGGPDTELILRAAEQWEKTHPDTLAGAVLLYPRLYKNSPEPGQAPEYLEVVGKTKLPIFVLEGERTPNRWSVDHLQQALAQGGSPVQVKVIPSVRGYFYNRRDANRSEEVVTSQLAGLIKVSLFYLSQEQMHE